MPSLKDVKMKIVGVRKTKQITKAMNMVASAKLRGASPALSVSAPTRKSFRLCSAILRPSPIRLGSSCFSSAVPECHVSVIILATSDRGLCGGFNAMLIAKALDAARTKTAEGKTVKFICVGKKGRDAIRKTGFEVLSSYADVMGSFDFSLASGIGKDVVSGYTHKAMDEVTLIYGKFVSVARQVPLVQTLLPVEAAAPATADSAADGTSSSGSVRRIHLRTRSDEAPCRNPSPVRQCADIPWPAGHFRERKRCPDVRYGQRHAQLRRNGGCADAALQQDAPDIHHQRAH